MAGVMVARIFFLGMILFISISYLKTVLLLGALKSTNALLNRLESTIILAS